MYTMHALHTVSHTVSLCANNTSFCFPKLCKNKFAKAAALRGKREKHANIDFCEEGVGSSGGVGRGRIQKQICEYFFYEGKTCKSKIRFVMQPLQNPQLRTVAASFKWAVEKTIGFFSHEFSLHCSTPSTEITGYLWTYVSVQKERAGTYLWNRLLRPGKWWDGYISFARNRPIAFAISNPELGLPDFAKIQSNSEYSTF
jgi:hypothetical protein